jgi:enoyl-[acyl-carrier protein] reductase III
VLLKGKNYLITGSSRGIGRELALAIAKEGGNVCIHYIFSQRNAFDLVDEISATCGVNVFATTANMDNPAEIKELFSTLAKEWGHLDGLLLNAASGNRKKLLEQTKEDWNRIAGINVLGPIQCVHEALPLFEQLPPQRTGRVIFLSSEGARYGIPHYGAIGVTKAALEGAMRQLVVELKGKPITLNTVSATLVRTLALDAVTHGNMDLFKPENFIEPSDIAKLILFLLSDLCPRSLHGQTLKLDHGVLSEYTPSLKENIHVSTPFRFP